MSPSPTSQLELKPIFLEAFFVVLGVVMALGANEWRQHLNEVQKGEVALQSITGELQENRQSIFESLSYHVLLADSLRAFEAVHATTTPDQVPDFRLFSRGYISPAKLLTTAWETANATDALNAMGYDDVLLLSHAYKDQEGYAHQTEESGRQIYAKLFEEGHEGMLKNYRNLRSIIDSFWYQECLMLATYDTVLTTLDTTYIPAQEPQRCAWVAR